MLTQVCRLSTCLHVRTCDAEGASNEAGIQLDPPAPVDAVMCVQIIRACGLLAAVNEASIWLGGGTTPSAP